MYSFFHTILFGYKTHKCEKYVNNELNYDYEYDLILKTQK